jgi:cytochrome b pre-mRNA-processing protein 3
MSHSSSVRPPRRRAPKATAIVALALVAAALVVVGVFLFDPDTERRAVRRLPEAERRALYGRTLRTLETSCAPAERSRGLDDYCREQAEFLLNFPECDAACRVISVKISGLPTR